jgi:hypothetical protein
METSAGGRCAFLMFLFCFVFVFVCNNFISLCFAFVDSKRASLNFILALQAIRFHNLTYGGGRMTMQNVRRCPPHSRRSLQLTPPRQVRSVMLRERFTKLDDAGWHCSFFRCFAFAFVRHEQRRCGGPDQAHV